MRSRPRLARPHPRWRTVRMRLAILYTGLFLVAGAGLLVIPYLLPVTQILGRLLSVWMIQAVNGVPMSGPGGAPASQEYTETLTLGQRLIQSGTALAIMAVVAVVLGWLAAGRILRPLRTMTAATRQISEDELHRRLALPGPSDELKDLGDTIDGLLGRLETAFDAQRRFVANASHELRTPLTLQRAMLEVALADPGATVESLRSACERVLVVGQQQERLIEALLTLARSQRGLDQRQRIDLAAIAGEVLLAHQPEAQRRGLQVDAALGPAWGSGDPRLVERLVANLVDNALGHNVPRGRVEVTTTTRGDRAVLSVSNTGPLVPAGQVERLLQPFQRLAPDRAAGRDGLGLGLSIATAIATAHEAAFTARPGLAGGLDIEVTFPASPASSRD